MKSAVVVVLLLAASMVLALSLGVRSVSPGDIWTAITAYDPSNPVHITLAMIRMPRLIAGLIAGAGLGVAGTLMQALTRNPLADPGLLGINSGAAFTIVLGALVFGVSDNGAISAMAFPGAAATALAVFALGGGIRGDAGPIRLTLAGTALNALLLSLVSAIILTRQETMEVYRFWVAGSLAPANTRPLGTMALVGLCGMALAALIAPRVEALSLGGAMARGLGTHPGRTQFAALVAVTLMTGAAVSVAGPIAFLGLLVPPVARRLSGHVLRLEILAAAAIGASLLLLADTAGRLIIPPAEIRVGVMTALIGAPVFIWLARRLRPGAGA